MVFPQNYTLIDNHHARNLTVFFFLYRSRKEYLELLRNDLMNYYSYSEFMIDKLMDMFPLSEVADECLCGIALSPCFRCFL